MIAYNCIADARSDLLSDPLSPKNQSQKKNPPFLLLQGLYNDSKHSISPQIFFFFNSCKQKQREGGFVCLFVYLFCVCLLNLTSRLRAVFMVERRIQGRKPKFQNRFMFIYGLPPVPANRSDSLLDFVFKTTITC